MLYSYRFSGSSTMAWTDAGNQHVVSYASLQPGSYLFEVRNKGWNGSWGEITAFTFVIFPPFWQSWWFIALCILTIGFFVYILVRRRIKGIRNDAGFVVVTFSLFARTGVMNVAEDCDVKASAHEPAHWPLLPAGRRMLNVVPFLGSLCTVISPLCS